MELSARAAATLMGRSPRTVRAQLARGDLPGIKRDGRWWIDRSNLPLTDAQRRGLQAKADQVRSVVEDALPSRSAQRVTERTRSVADLDGFRLGADVLASLRTAEASELAPGTKQRVCQMLEASLLALSEAALHFDCRAKREALNRCRSQLAQTIGLLLLTPKSEAAVAWTRQLEEGMVASVAGFARWVDKLQEKRR